MASRLAEIEIKIIVGHRRYNSPTRLHHHSTANIHSAFGQTGTKRSKNSIIQKSIKTDFCNPKNEGKSRLSAIK